MLMQWEQLSNESQEFAKILVIQNLIMYLNYCTIPINFYSESASNINVLGDSQNYMAPILVPFSAKRIATQILVSPW